MRPDQLELLTTVSPTQIHPSGEWAVVSTSRPSFAIDAYVGQLWRIRLDGPHEPTRITRGRSDGQPKFSPDGTALAFVRAVEGKPQLHLVEADGGEPVQITDQLLGVSEFCFSPDGTTVAFTARVPEPGRYGTDDDISAAAENPRHFTGNKLQLNGLGWATGRPLQVFTVPVPSLAAEPIFKPIGRAKPSSDQTAAQQEPSDQVTPAEVELFPQPTRLTHDEIDWQNPVFTPDGTGLIIAGNPHNDREVDLVTDLYRLNLASGKTTRLTNNGSGKGKPWISASSPVFSLDGTTLFFLGQPLGSTGVDFIGHHAQVFALPAKGSGRPVALTSTEYTVASTPVPFTDNAVVVTDDHRGSGRVLKVDADGAVSVLYQGGLMAQAVAAHDSTVVATVAGPTTMGEVAVIDDGQARLLTDFSRALVEQTTVVTPIEFTATGADGYPVHGWVLKPAGQGSSGKKAHEKTAGKKARQSTSSGQIPVLLNIHGGPYAAYHDSYFDEFQALVEAGYAVVACNPRGAMGYGAEHGQAIKGDFGNLDMADVLTFLDQALAENPDLDASRVGVMGGSYGGYLTAWIIGHDHRWAGAIVERGFLDPATFVGSSDIGWFFPIEYNGADLAEMNRQSPMWLTDSVTTPTMVVHSEQDLRCPLAQGLTYYGRLKHAGVEAELVVFPGENHELSRSGTPWHRRQRFEHILDFWARHLPVG